MTRYDRRVRLLAAGLSAIAGYVDAIGFLSLGGFFVSFMSGNSTRLGVGLANGSVSALIAAALIATFVTGVAIGSIVGRLVRARRRPAVLGLVALLLAIAASLDMASQTRPAIIAMGLAMGAENAVFERDGEIHISLTYMTGTLVKVGQRIASIPFGGGPWAWTPYFLLWLGLVTGAVAGALVYPSLGLAGLWIAAGAAGLFALVAVWMGPDRSDPT
ncbi:hypothetical protein AWL63_24320 (plasmid) [Sphingomonas panacis]|uniref:DUF1275 domain-containing protein n=2 Tax=Sphingomonas panacis TaxID=1560345 RepID=A0A1B3ZIM2_9SPHN|nr:hypothetical protein AWL63_24320 [Sphingomonas panacis]